MKIGDSEIDITIPCDSGRPVGEGTTSIICDEVDDYCAAVNATGARPKTGPGDRMDGLRNFAVLGPHGNQLASSCDVEGN